MMHVHLNDCDSTQDHLKEQLRKTPNETILISCEKQLKGRGRGDHEWTALAGSLCFSLSIDAHVIPSFTAIEISLLVAKYFEIKGEKLLLKWPNDLFTSNEKKCGGILVQSHGDKMMAGIGINLFSENHAYGGIYESEFSHTKKSWCLEIAQFITQNRYQETSLLISEWQSRCLHFLATVEIEEAGKKIVGKFSGLGVHGEALLETPEGTKHIYNGSLKRTTYL